MAAAAGTKKTTPTTHSSEYSSAGRQDYSGGPGAGVVASEPGVGVGGRRPSAGSGVILPRTIAPGGSLPARGGARRGAAARVTVADKRRSRGVRWVPLSIHEAVWDMSSAECRGCRGETLE